MRIATMRRAWPAWMLLAIAAAGPTSARAGLPKVPDGFEIRLVAAVPAVEYPCQVATAPDGSLFVAEDPMDQVGPYEVDNGRILLFKDGKDPVVFAEGFRAIFGMAWHDGALYVMNMPRLTVLRDTDGDGKADEKAELYKDLGPGPIKGALNDHIVSGLQFGIDGYLYISVGDKGVPKAHGRDGSTVTLKGGGVLRCRPDGTKLELYSSGTRNHLEPNLDDRDNLFTYDNTDDGLGWWTRVTHHIDGGYYGYAYDYHDRPDRMLNRIAEFGGGSPCGGVVYKEDAWPEKYRGRVFWAEWGKREVPAFRFKPDGASFKIDNQEQFVSPGDVGDFRPIDLALSYDGKTLYIADWSMGGWGNKNEKLGRVFAVTCKDEIKQQPRGSDDDPIDAQIKALDHPSFNERMRAQLALIKKGKAALGPVTTALAAETTPPLARRHLIWALDGIAGGTPGATGPLVAILKGREADLRAQAARALGERKVKEAVAALVPVLNDREPAVRLQAIIALGRIGDPRAVAPILPHLAEDDPYLAFSSRVALRRIGDWKGIARGLTGRDPKVRAGALLSLEEVYDPEAVAVLSRYAADAKHPADERAKALGFLAASHHKAPPWDGRWWGTQPARGGPPAKTIAWKGTEAVVKAVRQALKDPAAPVRIAAVKAVRDAKDRAALPELRRRLSEETDQDARREVIAALGGFNDKAALPGLALVLRDPRAAEPVREAAIAAVEAIGGDQAAKALADLLARRDVPVALQPRVIRSLGGLKAKGVAPALVKALGSPAAPVRAASAEALGKVGEPKGVAARLRPLLKDKDLAVRKAAIGALATLKDRESFPDLLALAEDESTQFEATRALADLPEIKALHVYLRGLASKSPDLRRESARAIGAIRDQAAPVLDKLAARKELSPRVVPELKRIYRAQRPILQWRLLGPFKKGDAAPFPLDKPVDLSASFTGLDGNPARWREVQAHDPKGEVNLGRVFSDGSGQSAFGYAEVRSEADRTAHVTVGSDDTLTVWVNGNQVYDSQGDRGFEYEQGKFDVPLVAGANRIVIKCGNSGGNWQFAVAVSEPTDYAFLNAPAGGFDPEAYREAALKGGGKAEHGKALFFDLKGVACVKCHNVGGQGGLVGPELSSVGAKYPRGELITAVLNPSAKISQGYEPVVVALNDGRVVTGIVKVETADAIEVEDADAKRIKLAKADIDERKPADVSIMPTGLAEGLTPRDFNDLIAFLETLKQVPANGGQAAGDASRKGGGGR
ncbi:MAG TPA: PVC-type heme-binding CxxCH protein [Isosphaeraceae bacterium]|jgi:putative membrane-bound dehydrogenase-like protein|nr:PVC-type heme-binding CxxCH protein [Isosphaeraceae bacterium]